MQLLLVAGLNLSMGTAVLPGLWELDLIDVLNMERTDTFIRQAHICIAKQVCSPDICEIVRLHKRYLASCVIDEFGVTSNNNIDWPTLANMYNICTIK